MRQEQGGWTDPTFALRVYAKAVKCRSKLSRAYLEAFDRALHGQKWAETPMLQKLALERRTRPTRRSRMAKP